MYQRNQKYIFVDTHISVNIVYTFQLSAKLFLKIVLLDLCCRTIKHEFQNNALYILYLTLKYAFDICGHAPKPFSGYIMLFYSDVRSKKSNFYFEIDYKTLK